MTWWLLAIGILGVVAALIDLLLTALSASERAGPITAAVTGLLWRTTGKTRRRRQHRALAIIGMTSTVSVVLVWMLLLWGGWAAVFASDPTAVRDAHTRDPADRWDIVYFAGYSILTLGNGDLAPSGGGWQMATVAATGTGLFAITLGITYVLGVVTAATEKRQTAALIWALGHSSDQVIAKFWNGRDLGSLDSRLVTYIPALTRLAERHLIYPVLHHFHATERRAAIGPNVAMLDQVVTLNRGALDKDIAVSAATLDAVDEVIDAYLETLPRGASPSPRGAPALPSLDPLRRRGIPTVDKETYEDNCAPRRRRMAVLTNLLEETGWEWDELAATGPDHQDR